jgi:hypothetical protein
MAFKAYHSTFLASLMKVCQLFGNHLKVIFRGTIFGYDGSFVEAFGLVDGS